MSCMQVRIYIGVNKCLSMYLVVCQIRQGGSGGSKKRATAEQQAAWAPEGWCFDYMLGGCGRHTGKCKDKSQFTHPTSAEQKTHGKKKKKRN